MSPVFLDPSYEELPRATVLPERPVSLRGATVGVISNGKAGTRPYFDHLEHMLRDELRGSTMLLPCRSLVAARRSGAVCARCY